MSLYNIVQGMNPAADLILATLGLTRNEVGRFRDAFVTDNDEIAVYTRNGGGNRECWHHDHVGNADCKGRSWQEEEDEYVLSHGTYGSYQKTGRRVMNTKYSCDEPESAACGCPGCIVSHRLPEHPCYLRDEDDDFDYTYATIYFKFPDEFSANLKKLSSGQFDPDQNWQAAIENLSKGNPTRVMHLKPFIEAMKWAIDGTVVPQNSIDKEEQKDI
jgi:hypothetical protein